MNASSGQWEHMICDACWKDIHPNREPVRMIEKAYRAAGPCCWCDQDQCSGVYIRQSPETVPCAGIHLVDQTREKFERTSRIIQEMAQEEKHWSNE